MRTRIAAFAIAALTVTGITAATVTTTGDVTPRTVIQAEPVGCPSLMAMCAPTPPAPAGLTDEQRAADKARLDALADDYARAFEEVKA